MTLTCRFCCWPGPLGIIAIVEEFITRALNMLLKLNMYNTLHVWFYSIKKIFSKSTKKYVALGIMLRAKYLHYFSQNWIKALSFDHDFVTFWKNCLIQKDLIYVWASLIVVWPATNLYFKQYNSKIQNS